MHHLVQLQMGLRTASHGCFLYQAPMEHVCYKKCTVCDIPGLPVLNLFSKRVLSRLNLVYCTSINVELLVAGKIMKRSVTSLVPPTPKISLKKAVNRVVGNTQDILQRLAHQFALTFTLN